MKKILKICVPLTVLLSAAAGCKQDETTSEPLPAPEITVDACEMLPANGGSAWLGYRIAHPAGGGISHYR